jgi:hypothetical protein
MAAYIKEFRERGGSIRMPPHPVSERLAWVAEAKRYREEWEYDPPEKRTDKRRRGLGYMWHSVQCARCIVATRNHEIVAAASYFIRPHFVEVKVLGSRQLDEARGAATAIEFALAEEAARRGFGVRSEYTWSERNFHVRIGRRLDQRGHQTSDWTPEDCHYLVTGIKELL